MKVSRILLLLLIVLSPFSMVQAQSAQTWQTGQTTSYAVGDDGDLQRGVSWPAPRFEDNGDGTVTDNLTGLIWLKNANCAGTMNWNNALTYCNNLASGLCGLTDGSVAGDWRLPNRKELMSLVDYGNYIPPLPNGHPFTDVQSSFYWSATTDAYLTGYAWYVGMECGGVYSNGKSYNYYVWPVLCGQGGLFGDLTVSIEPTEARSAGARWRVDGGAWHESGDTQYGLTAGEHMLEFNTISGWNKPVDQQVVIVEGQTTEVIGTYTEEEPGTWLGYTTDWGSITNWSTGMIPDLSTTVTIPYAPSGGNFPVIDEQAVAHRVTIKDGNINIQSGGELTLVE